MGDRVPTGYEQKNRYNIAHPQNITTFWYHILTYTSTIKLCYWYYMNVYYKEGKPWARFKKNLLSEMEHGNEGACCDWITIFFFCDPPVIGTHKMLVTLSKYPKQSLHN